jgi:transcription elongation factor Elf1
MQFRCLHCDSERVETIMDEVLARWIRCQDCGKESVLGSRDGPNRIEVKI